MLYVLIGIAMVLLVFDFIYLIIKNIKNGKTQTEKKEKEKLGIEYVVMRIITVILLVVILSTLGIKFFAKAYSVEAVYYPADFPVSLMGGIFGEGNFYVDENVNNTDEVLVIDTKIDDSLSWLGLDYHRSYIYVPESMAEMLKEKYSVVVLRNEKVAFDINSESTKNLIENAPHIILN